MKQFLSVLMGKLVFKIGRHFTNCSSLPGKVALMLNKDVLKNIKKKNNKIIFITGTNGKTSTTFYSYNSILKYEKNVITNLSGANMLQGVLTEILKNTTSNTFKDNICVFEVDELTVPLLIKNGLHPDYIVITNLFDDQVDRYDSKEKLAKTLRDYIEKTTAKLIINFECKTLRIISDNIKNECVFFGVEGKSDKIIKKDNLEYKYINYGDVGLFRNVGEDSFLDLRNFILKSDNIETLEVFENGKNVIYNVSNREKFDIIYNKYNYMAAFSLFKTLVKDDVIKNFDESDIFSFMMNLELGNGRMEKLTFLNEDTKLNLVKNPIGLSLSLKEYEKCKDTFDLVLSLGNTPADGTDLSWIKTVDFRDFFENSKVDKIFITGKAYKILQDLLKEYVEKNNLNIKFIKKDSLRESLNKKTLFLAGFSELKNMREFIVE